MKNLNLNFYFIYLPIVFFSNTTITKAQTINSKKEYFSGSISQISDTTLKSYLAFFVKTDLAKPFVDDAPRNKKLLASNSFYCGDKSVSAHRGSWIIENSSATIKVEQFNVQKHQISYEDSSQSVKIDGLSMIGSKQIPISIIQNIRFCTVGCRRLMLDLPIEAINDICEPDFCISQKKNWLGKVSCKSCFVTFSNRFWTFIYLQGGVKSNRYEVTWIIKGDEYYGRVIDELQNK
jgi:hypothetical protein